MPWLTPSVIATMAGTALLTLVYFYLYLQDRKAYLAIWAVSWAIYFTRYAFMLLMISGHQHTLLLIGNQAASLISGIVLLWGTCRFAQKKFRTIWIVGTGLGLFWIVVCAALNVSFMATTLPTFSFLAAAYIWTGVIFIRSRITPGHERHITGWGFVLWGIHKGNYPFLRPVTWFAPYGYLIAAMLEFIVAVGILLTYLQKVRNELRVSEAKQKAMIANISDVIAVFDADCTIVYKSPNIERWFGWRPEDLIGTDGWKTVHPEDLDRVQNEFSELLEEADRARTVTYRYQCKDGSYKWIELTAVNLLKDTAICGILANYRDITTRRLAEEQIRQLQKAESLGRMAGAVAHHYNNLLFSVMGNLELAGDDVPKDSVVAENMQQALASAGKAAKLSRLLLSYLGQTPGRFEVLDISEHCRLALPALQPDLPDNLALEADLISSELMVSLDPEQTRQILDNLITNAREAMEGQTGRIVLRLTKVSREAILGSNRFPADWQPRQKHYACLEVTDTGVGIAAEDIGKVFDPFYTGKHTGRGLGLAVVLGNVKSHAGCITVASEPGLGSTFRVFWPLTEAKVVEAVAEVPPAAQTTKAGETILVVDDQESVRRVSKALLERLGFEVITAGDGAEAVEIFRENPDTIKLVLSDLSMPRMNGWETLAALRAIRGDIPVILASGYDEAKALSGGHAEQPQAFLQKPYQMQTLQETLHRALAAGNTSINLQS